MFLGPPECVEAARKKIEAIVDDLASRVAIDVVIEQKHHRTIMGAKGAKVQQIQMDHNVEIKFPERQDDPEYVSEENGNGVRYSDIITVCGRRENCEAAKEALLSHVPVRVEVDIPYEMHRFIIGKSQSYFCGMQYFDFLFLGSKGKDVRDLMHTYDVNIAVPPQENHSDVIVVKILFELKLPEVYYSYDVLILLSKYLKSKCGVLFP